MVLSILLEKVRSRFFLYRKGWLTTQASICVILIPTYFAFVFMKTNVAFAVLQAAVCFAHFAASLLDWYQHRIKTIQSYIARKI